jgi:hypothetical protein
MPAFNAADIIGKTLIAKRQINVLSSPDGPPLAVVLPGNSVGVVDTYIGGTAGRPLYWAFIGQNNRPYYVLHSPGNFDVSALRAQGVLTTKEQQDEKNKTPVMQLAKSGGAALIIFSIILGASIFYKQTRRRND